MNISNLARTVILSAQVALISTGLNLLLALVLYYLLSGMKERSRSLIEGVVNLPLVMPPVTIGYLLLMFLGRNGLLGKVLFQAFGLRIAFTQAAAVIASMVVSFPLVYRNIKLSGDMLDGNLSRTASTLGAGRRDVFLRITLPLIVPGILQGAILGFARSLGEFGATITFAGNILGRTQTIPLAVYSYLQIPGKEAEAAIMVGISIGISFLAMILSGLLARRSKGENHVS